MSHKIVVVAGEPIRVDRTPPVAGYVRDGSTADNDYQNNNSTICVSWGGFSDPDTGISLYQWKVETSSGSNDTLDLRNLTTSEVSLRRSCQSGLTLTDNTTYYSTITAVNGATASQSISKSSDGGKKVIYNLKS